MLDKKVLFCSSDEHGCGWYRTKLIADYLKQTHCWFFPALKKDDGTLVLGDQRVFDAEVVVIQRHSNDFFIDAIPTLQAMGKKVVYDLDDNLWHIPASNPAHNMFPAPMLKTTKKIIQSCDYVTVSTEPLKQWMLKEGFNDKIVVVPNMLVDVLEFKERDNSKIRIGYAGSPTHVGDFSYRLTDALRKLKREHDCELVFMGYNPIKGSETEYSSGCKVENYLETLNDLNLDIALAPLASNLFNECKSNLKFLEYSACSFTTIASPVYPYINTLKYATTGDIVGDEREWFRQLLKMVEDRDNRIRMARNAHTFVKENFTYKYNGQLIANIWQGIIEEMYGIH